MNQNFFFFLACHSYEQSELKPAGIAYIGKIPERWYSWFALLLGCKRASCLWLHLKYHKEHIFVAFPDAPGRELLSKPVHVPPPNIKKASGTKWISFGSSHNWMARSAKKEKRLLKDCQEFTQETSREGHVTHSTPTTMNSGFTGCRPVHHIHLPCVFAAASGTVLRQPKS